MGLLGTSLYLAFDAGSVSAATLSRGPGRRRVEGFVRAPLGTGALSPSPVAANVVGRDEVRQALTTVLEGVAFAGGKARLLLPDGIARLGVFEPPSGADSRDYVRFRLAPSLPWPASDAIVEVLPAGRGRVIGAAIRRATVSQYEQLAAAAGLTVERVHLSPLVVLASFLRRGTPSGVHVVLGDAAFCLGAIQGGTLCALRSRRRDPSEGEADRLLAEASRTAHLAGDGHGPVPLTLSGAGAEQLRLALGPGASGGLEGPPGWPQAIDAAWLAGILG